MPRRKNSLIRDCDSSTPSITMRQHAPSAMPRNSIPSWRWRIGVWPERLLRTTTILPAIVVSTLESVIKRDPNHMGAVHYYIHSVEGSRSPERALAGANRLADLEPGAGHIVHMPAHIYIRTGDYDAAVKTNEKAAAVDQAYLKASGAQGIYPMMYYSHNLSFIAMCSAMNGNYDEAKKTADLLAAHVGPHVKDMPP